MERSPSIHQILQLFRKKTKCAILLSGGGSNAEVLLQNRERYPNLDIVVLASDRTQSRAAPLAERYETEYFVLEGKVRQPEMREHYFQRFSQKLDEYGVELLLYAGFMKISTPSFVSRFPGVNMHPSDLSLVGSNGLPKYVGMHVIQEAIEAEESYLASTLHVVEAEVDCGQPIAVTNHLPLAAVDRNHLHEQLKSQCEHKAYPYLLQLLSRGKITAGDLPLQLEYDEQFQQELKTKQGALV